MKKTWLVVGLALLLLVVGFYGCSQSPALSANGSDLHINLNSQQEGIWVNGIGEVTAVPDIAVLRLGIDAQAATVSEAQSRAADAMAKVMKALTDNGVATKDIQTQQFSIQKVTRWDKDTQVEIVVGYRVTNVVTAKIRNLAKAGATIDAAAAAGGDLTRIDGISFSIDNPTNYQQDARQKALADAGAKAKQMADGTGVKLGKPTFISENSYYPPPMPITYDKAAGAPAMSETPISPGEMKITVNVQVTYAILE